MVRLPRPRKSLSIARKNFRIYYGKGPVVIFGILLPFFFFLAFLVGKEMSSLSLVAGLSGMTVWFTSTSISPAIAPSESGTKTLERLVASPISVTEILLGDILGSMMLAIAISTVVVAVVAAILSMTPVHIAALVLGLILASFCFSAIGILMSAPPTDNTADIMMLSTLIRFPLIFVSGIFIPVEELAGWGSAISRLSPLTYFVDLVRFAFSGNGHPGVDLAALCAFSGLFLMASTFFHRRTLPKRL